MGPEPTTTTQVEERARYAYQWEAVQRADEDPGHQENLLELSLAAFATRVEQVRADTNAPPPVDFDKEALSQELRDIVASVEHEAVVSVHVRDLLSGQPVFDHFGDVLLNPASNHKIVTASAAIDLLGPKYVFETDLAYQEGVLYVRGQGDPTLDEDALGFLVRSALEELGDAPIEAVVVDDTAFSSAHFAPGFDRGGLGASYQAPSGALSLNFNTVEVTVYPIAGQWKPAVRVEPESTRVRVLNSARVTSSEALWSGSRWNRAKNRLVTTQAP